MKTIYPSLVILSLILIVGACKPTQRLTFKKPVTTAKFEKDRLIIFEKGMASMMKAKQDSYKYQALHRYAPIGSFTRVTNLANGKLVIVSVIGKLPKDAPKNVVIQLTKRACKQIDVTENMITPVEIDFDIEIPESLTPPKKPRVIVKNTGKSNDVFDLIRPGGALYGNKKLKKNEVGKFTLLQEKNPDKFYAYHRTIPKGSYIRISEKNTIGSVVVKVVGKPSKHLPDDVIIQFTKNIYQQMGLSENSLIEINRNPEKSVLKSYQKKLHRIPPTSNNVFDLIRPFTIKIPTKKTKEEKAKTIIFEQGMATPMNKGNHNKYHALHRTAPMGSLVLITNLDNGHKVVVGIVGKLPDNAPKNVIIQLAKRAYDHIWSRNPMPVEIEYDFEKKKK